MNKIIIAIIILLLIAIGWVGFNALTPDAPAVVDTTMPAPDMTASSTPEAVAEPIATFTLDEVAMHNSTSDCYTTVRGVVYDLTPFVNKHPGGVENIARLCGIDGTSAFTAQHGGQRKPENELAGLEVGVLAQ